MLPMDRSRGEGTDIGQLTDVAPTGAFLSSDRSRNERLRSHRTFGGAMSALYGKELVDDSIVFVVDMIKDFLDPGEEFVIDEGRSMYEKLGALLTFARGHHIPIVHSASQGMNKSLYEDHWWQIRERVSCQEGSPTVDAVDALRPVAYDDHEIYIPKSKYSPFYGTRLDTYLRNPPFLGRNTIIVTGMATNFCCFCTSSDAFKPRLQGAVRGRPELHLPRHRRNAGGRHAPDHGRDPQAGLRRRGGHGRRDDGAAGPGHRSRSRVTPASHPRAARVRAPHVVG